MKIYGCNILNFFSNILLEKKMLKRPTPDAGAFIKLHSLLEERKAKRSVKFAVVVFGLLEEPHDNIHGIFWVCDVFNVYNEAQSFVDEIIEKTGMTHVKILQLGISDVLSTNIDPNMTRVVNSSISGGINNDETIEKIERQNIRESAKEKKDQIRINKIISQEKELLNDSQSQIYYGHTWMKYIQNRMIREQTQESVTQYLEIENKRKDELISLQSTHPEHEKTWLPIFCKYREELDEKAAAQQVESLWLKYRQEVFPAYYS